MQSSSDELCLALFKQQPLIKAKDKMDKLMGVSSDEEVHGSHDLGSDEEFFGGKPTKFDGSDDEDMSDEEEEVTQKVTKGKSKKPVFDAFDEHDSDEEEEDEDEDEDEKHDAASTVKTQETEEKKSKGVSEEEKNVNELFRKSKLKALKDKKPKGKTGVIYMSKIPPYMKPTKMRQILSRFGEVDRLFLKSESTMKHQQRIKRGGNKKVMYEEGWAEFIRKKDAKLAADTLNANTLGGKKGSFYYDDVMNVKYLSGFKWGDLTDQITKEKEVRDSKLQMEVMQARKMNKTFVQNIQKSKMIENIQKKKKSNSGDKGSEKSGEDKFRRTFEQRKVTTARADGPAAHKKNDQPNKLVSKLL